MTVFYDSRLKIMRLDITTKLVLIIPLNAKCAKFLLDQVKGLQVKGIIPFVQKV